MNGFYVNDFFNKNKKLFLLIVVLVMAAPLFAQDKLVDKANEHYKLNQFAEAAGLFEQALNEMDEKRSSGRNAFNLKVKLAYCYRMNNKMDKAEALYADVVQDANAKPDTYYYYGETLMSNGKYEEARKWFLDYQKLQPEDEKARLMIEACDKIPLIEPYFQYVDVQEFAYNSTADDNAPIAWRGGILFSSDREQGFKLLKEKSGWTGRDYLDLYFSEKKGDGTYAEPNKFSSRLSEVNKNTGNASLTADGSEIFFTRNDNVLNKQNTYNLQIFSAQSAGEDRWKKVEKLSFCTPNFNFMHPAVSPDGQQLFFVSNKTGGKGGTDIWVAQRKGEDWGKPENLGPIVNTPANEGFPFMDQEGRLYFCSKGHPGFGGFDIFVTEKDENNNWTTPLNLGKPFNSSLDDISIYIAPDRRNGMFTSSRSGGDDDIFLFQVSDQPLLDQPVVSTVPPLVVESGLSVPQETPDEGKLETVKTEQPEVQPKKRIVEQVTEVEVQELKPAIQPENNAKQPDVHPTAKEQLVQKNQPPASPFLSEPVFPENTDGKKKDENIPASTEAPKDVQVAPKELTVSSKDPEIKPAPSATALVAVPSFEDLINKLEYGHLQVGDYFRLGDAVYDPNVWQLTPRIAAMLDKVADILLHFPSLEVEIGAYTETLGNEVDNLRLSQNRAEMAVDYLVSEGISKKRLSAKGYGETTPLNHCHNGVTCSMEEHLFNQRLEVRILRIEGGR